MVFVAIFSLILGRSDLDKLPSDDFDRAAYLWKEFGMPVPSLTARPVMVKLEDQTGKEFAFLDNIVGEYAYLNSGTRRISGKRNDFQIDVLNYQDKIVLPRSYNYSHRGFPENTATAGAIQSVLLGHREFAKSLYDANKVAFNFYFYVDSIAATVDDSLSAQCALLILTHIVNDFLTPGSNAKTALQKLSQLNTYRLLKNSGQYPWWGPNSIVKALTETASISPTKAGCAQDAVDGLTEISRDPSKYWNYFSLKETPQYINALRFGLEAVEPLAKELDEKRLTRLYEPISGNSPPGLYPVHLVANQLLKSIANGDLGESQVLKRDVVESWIAAKRADSVDAWLLGRLTKPGYHRLDSNGQTWDAIVHAHPKLIREALKIIHDKDIDQTYALYWIDNSTLSTKEKHDLVIYASDSHFIVQLRGGLEYVRQYDQTAFDNFVLRILDQCPRHLDENYADISSWVGTTNNEHIWKRLEEVIGKADVLLRSCLLKTLGRAYSSNEGKSYVTRGIPILRKYFDDDSRIKDFKHNNTLYEFSVVSGLDKEAPTIGYIALQAAAAAAGILPYDESNISTARWKEIRKKVERMVISRKSL